MRTYSIMRCVFIVSIASCAVVQAQQAELHVLNGPILVRFDRPFEELEITRGKQFGIFRALEPKTKQDITDSWRKVELPGKIGSMGALDLSFSVNDGYNGWWMKLGPESRGADWSRSNNGYLIVRILQAPPTFKVELKDAKTTYPVVVSLSQQQRATIARMGYVDVTIPLRSFAIPRLSGLRELVFVFESTRLERTARTGNMLIAQIGISKKAEFADDPDAILNDLSRRAFEWFKKHRHPSTGLVLDRAPNDITFTPEPDKAMMASVASVGYFLALLPEWVELGYIDRDEARTQAAESLRFVVEKTAHHNGLLFHFVNWSDGSRWETSEASSLDHGICATGAMTAAMAFGGDVEKLADQLLDRIDWNEFLVTNDASGKKLLSLGATPESGVLRASCDVRSSEMALAIFLAVGSKQAIDPQCWYNTHVDYRTVQKVKVLNAQHPLFTSMYGMNFHALNDKVDRDGVDLFSNARQAALLNRAFCRSLGKQEPTYSTAEGGFYGISAGDSPTGYRAAGPVAGDADGVVWPMTAIASLPWLTTEMKEDLQQWRNSRAWVFSSGPYGISPFRLGDRQWVGPDIIGIDIGSMAASLANARNRTIWNLWAKHPVSKNALDKLGISTKRR